MAKVIKVAKGSKPVKGSKAKAAASASVKRGKVIAKPARKAKAIERVLPAWVDKRLTADKLGDSRKISGLNLDKMKAGSDVRKRFAKVRNGMSIAAAIEAGVSRFDISCAQARGRLNLSK